MKEIKIDNKKKLCLYIFGLILFVAFSAVYYWGLL